MKQRDSYFDNIKFVLISLVVFGHILQNNFLQDRVSMAMFDWIFCFAMPLFVFMSGLFCNPNSASFHKSQLRLFETLVVFSLILKIPYLLGVIKNHIPIDSEEILKPGYTLWYLLALIWWRYLVYVIPVIKQQKHQFIVLLTSCVISLLSGFIECGNSFALPRTLFFLPYFLFGYYLSNNKNLVKSRVQKINKYIAVISLLFVFVLFYYMNYNQLEVNTGNVPYSMWSMGTDNAILWRILFSCISIISSVLVCSVIPQSKNRISFFGSRCLVIYVYHPIFLIFLKIVQPILNLPTGFVFSFIEWVVLMIILMLITKSPFLVGLTNPSTLIINTKK